MEITKEEDIPPSDEGSMVKSKMDWSHLNDIESLISEMKKGKKVRCIVFDTETTGVNYKKDHILELACVELINFGLTGRIYHIYIKPRVFVPKNVQELNHIRYDDFKKYWEYYNQDTKLQLQNLMEFIGDDSYLVAHNATFDYYFLNSELKYWGLPEYNNDRFRCTLRIVKKLFKDEGIDSPNFKLFTCCEYFKILVNENEGSYHNALFDTIMTSKLLIHLYKRYANINDIDNEYNKNYNKNNYNNNYNNKYNNQNYNKPRYNKFDKYDNENLNKMKEKMKNLKIEEKGEKEKNNNINNVNNINNSNENRNKVENINNENKNENKIENKVDNANNENKIENKVENVDNKDINEEQNKPKENNNELKEGKLNGVELNLLIQKMNEMIINEQNKENKKEE